MSAKQGEAGGGGESTDRHDLLISPPKHAAEDALNRSRIIAAEEWAAGLNRAAGHRARARVLIPSHRAARYRDLMEYFVGEIAAPERARIETALQAVLEAIETDIYGVPRPAAHEDPAIAALVEEGLHHAALPVHRHCVDGD